MTGRLLFASGLLLLAAPAVSAATGTMEFQPGFATAALHVEGTSAGQAAAGIRAAIDAKDGGGNGDGVVTHGEAVHFVVANRAVFEASITSAFRGSNLTLDGAAPTVDVGNLTLRDAEGRTDSTAPLATVLDATLRFAPGAGPTHRMVSKAPAGGTLEMTVRPPAGHRFEADPQGNTEVAADGRSASYSGGGEHILTFTPVVAKTAPGGWATALALGLAVAVRRVQAQK